MALFIINDQGKIKKNEVGSFKNEKELQILCESNLDELFQVRFVASEFPFADEYAGRLDTIGLDYEGNPVIIEYKLDRNPNVLSQVLFYMDWLVNHKGDFEIAVKKKYGEKITIQWDNPKMVLVAQEYNKYDKYAVNQISYDIYLYKYTYYKTGEFYLENINLKENKKYCVDGSSFVGLENNDGKYQRKQYDYAYHSHKANKEIAELLDDLNERVCEISDRIEVKYPKNYIAYRTTKNFIEVHVCKNKLQVYLLKSDYDDPRNKLEKVPDSYQWSLDQRIDIFNNGDLLYAIKLIVQSYNETL